MAQLSLRQSLETRSDDELMADFRLYAGAFLGDETDVARAKMAITAQMILNERAAIAEQGEAA